MEYFLDLSNIPEKDIYELNENFSGESRSGERLSFTNYYLQKNGKPYFGVSGEMHFSRMREAVWRDELLKAKMGGIRMITTYVLWIHHEEEEGVFDFSGNRNLRRFISICQELGLYVILRVGPFVHGEVRNGGLPDWLYGKPFEVRTLDEKFLSFVRTWYEKVAEQVKDLFFQDDGPIIGVQLDNEYMHSSAPWEITTGTSNEWIFPGDGGNAYMLKLKEIASESGLLPVFYTCTAWGGAIAPDSLMPLWGGYAFRPWIFYGRDGEIKVHPATEEYRYQDFHKNGVECTNDFKPNYPPETRPYACCEMGGGMMCTYGYRFQFDYKGVDAMANIKMASGCNFLGYYMYHGGTNPIGKHGVYLNENQVEKRSYDYQAAIGESGQLKESYRRLKSLHLFAETFEEQLCGLQTVLPDGAATIEPTDEKTLRYAVRTDGKRGFLFLNNFQDHLKLPDKKDEQVTLNLSGEKITFSIHLAGEENAILPFHFDMDGIDLVQATAQPVTKTAVDGMPCYVFLVPDGMDGMFVFESGAAVNGGNSNRIVCGKSPVTEFFVEKTVTGIVTSEKPVTEKFSANDKAATKKLSAESSLTEKMFTETGTIKVKVLAVNRSLANQMYRLKSGILLFTEEALLEEENEIRLETRKGKNRLYAYPADALEIYGGLKRINSLDIQNGSKCVISTDGENSSKCVISSDSENSSKCVISTDSENSSNREEDMLCGILGCYGAEAEEIPSQKLAAKLVHIANSRYQVELPDICGLPFKDILLRVTYRGDIGYAFLDGTLIHDNFYNGAVWEFSLSDYKETLKENPIVLSITPKSQNSQVRMEAEVLEAGAEADVRKGKVEQVELAPVYELRFPAQ